MVAILLTILFVVSLASPGASWHNSNLDPSDDKLYNQFGPMTSSLRITPYGSQEVAYEAFKTNEIDFMDSALNSSQIEELDAIDPNMTTYDRVPFIDRGIREIDMNNMKFPTNDTQFRKALEFCFDKDDFVAVTTSAVRMDSPIAWTADWNNPYCSNLYSYNLSAAESILDAADYVDRDSDGWREGPNGQEIILDFYIRQDDADRIAMGTLFAANLESVGIRVNARITTRSVCFQKVLGEFDFHLYTGAWAVTSGIGPVVFDFSNLYYSDFAQTSPFSSNYVGYSNPEFDFHIDRLLNASDIGDPYTSCTAKYHLYECQKILMDDAAIIPVFTYANYGGYGAAWENVVDEEGVGPWSWFTMLNTFKQGEDTINWGVVDDIQSFNVMVPNIGNGDWHILDKIYDKLLKINPYNVSTYEPWMAKDWTVGEWIYQGEPATWIEFKLREDMYWQDIAPKADRHTPNGTTLLVDGAYDEKVMADDIIFTIYALRDTPDAPYSQLVADVVSAEEVNPYTVRIYYSVHWPLWALLWTGDIPLMPEHIWEPIFLEGDILEFDPLSQECLSGCGPWLFDYSGSVPTEYYRLTANTRFFRYHPVDLFGTLDTNQKVVSPGTTVTTTFWLHNLDFQRVIPPSEFAVTITIEYYNGTIEELHMGSSPQLPPCEEIPIFVYTDIYPRGLHSVIAIITPDSLTGHSDLDGYVVNIWGTIPEDIDLDFYVNGKDGTLLGVAFGSVPGRHNWNLKCDINGDGFVNAKDAVRLGTKFNWPNG
jgi:ABC-type oligopeptide transport system substrate-binding subunit